MRNNQCGWRGCDGWGCPDPIALAQWDPVDEIVRMRVIPIPGNCEIVLAEYEEAKDLGDASRRTLLELPNNVLPPYTARGCVGNSDANSVRTVHRGRSH